MLTANSKNTKDITSMSHTLDALNTSASLSIHGRAAIRVFTYAGEDGIHHEFTAPGGAALVARILGGNGLAATMPPDASFKREYLELARHEDKQDKQNQNPRVYYAIARSSGITPGAVRMDTAPAPHALLWDGNLGDGNFETLSLSAETPVLWASQAGLPEKEPFAQLAARCFLLLDADLLRAHGAMISRQISWERTATDLVWQMHNNPEISYLLQAPRILVTFAEDGAVYLHRDGRDRDGSLAASLILTHGGAEGSLREKLKEGKIDDAFAVMTAATALQFADVMSGKKPLRVLPILKSAEALMLSGYSIDNLKNSAFALMDANAPSASAENKTKTTFEIPIKPAKPGENANDPVAAWCISNSVSNKHIFDIACDYVKNGAKVIDGLPQLSFGALTTIDRWEIEAFQNIRNLIVSYAGADNVRPLSIAVFGSPGSGKSFGVTQIAKNVIPGKVEKLEFNVSQLTGLNDLGAAFQKVRDVILEGKLPLVFFDEFDSDRDGRPLGWIKSFLMPMQDGKFKDDTGEHPLGKCILVFAGGTAASFEDFIAPMQSEAPDQQRQEFKNIKGPDFVSRLRGTINVLGPNPKDKNDKNYILRRALLLRSLCERKLRMKKGEAPISPDILWAMLLVPNYKHGARSMEAILDMSRIEGNKWEPVSLPFHSQLSLHVDAGAFIKLVLREVILNSYIEQLAQAIHADYLKGIKAAGDTTHSSAADWADLPEDLREANRAQARSIAKKLRMIDHAYDAGDTPFPSVEAFDEATVLRLAREEHIRWMQERIAAGWTYGPVRDNAKKIHPLLVDWDELPDKEKQKDIDAINNIIPLLKSIGLRVYKTI